MFLVTSMFRVYRISADGLVPSSKENFCNAFKQLVGGDDQKWARRKFAKAGK
jgi:hypothetical protein